jgi:hypothetical protein
MIRDIDVASGLRRVKPFRVLVTIADDIEVSWREATA